MRGGIHPSYRATKGRGVGSGPPPGMEGMPNVSVTASGLAAGYPTVPWISLHRLSARSCFDTATGLTEALFDAELLVRFADDGREGVWKAAEGFGTGIYEWTSSRDPSPRYIQVRNGSADWLRIDIALRKVVERDCGRKRRPAICEPWIRAGDVRREALRQIVEALVPIDADYSVRVFGRILGRPSLTCRPWYLGLQLDEDVCEDVGRQLGTVLVEGMLAVAVAAAGRFLRIDCIEFGRDAPREVVRYALVDEAAGFDTERIVVVGPDVETVASLEAERGRRGSVAENEPNDEDDVADRRALSSFTF